MLDADIRFWREGKRGRPTKVNRALSLLGAAAHELKPVLARRVRIDNDDLARLRADWLSVGESLDWLESRRKVPPKGEQPS